MPARVEAQRIVLAARIDHDVIILMSNTLSVFSAGRIPNDSDRRLQPARLALGLPAHACSLFDVEIGQQHLTALIGERDSEPSAQVSIPTPPFWEVKRKSDEPWSPRVLPTN